MKTTPTARSQVIMMKTTPIGPYSLVVGDDRIGEEDGGERSESEDRRRT